MTYDLSFSYIFHFKSIQSACKALLFFRVTPWPIFPYTLIQFKKKILHLHQLFERQIPYSLYLAHMLQEPHPSSFLKYMCTSAPKLPLWDVRDPIKSKPTLYIVAFSDIELNLSVPFRSKF